MPEVYNYISMYIVGSVNVVKLSMLFCCFAGLEFSVYCCRFLVQSGL